MIVSIGWWLSVLSVMAVVTVVIAVIEQQCLPECDSHTGSALLVAAVRHA